MARWWEEFCENEKECSTSSSDFCQLSSHAEIVCCPWKAKPTLGETAAWALKNLLLFLSCPSSTLLLPLSSAVPLDCFPVWTEPGRTPLGEQRACWPSFFFSGEARLIQLHWQPVFPRRVAKHVGPLLRELRQHSVMEKPFKSVSSEPPEEARADSRIFFFFFFYQPQEPPKQLPKLCQQLPLEIQILQPVQGQLHIPGGAPQNYTTGMWHPHAWEHHPLDLV